jgi:hypothetical protein
MEDVRIDGLGWSGWLDKTMALYNETRETDKQTYELLIKAWRDEVARLKYSLLKSFPPDIASHFARVLVDFRWEGLADGQIRGREEGEVRAATRYEARIAELEAQLAAR